jgi:hypothetical protein
MFDGSVTSLEVLHGLAANPGKWSGRPSLLEPSECVARVVTAKRDSSLNALTTPTSEGGDPPLSLESTGHGDINAVRTTSVQLGLVQTQFGSDDIGLCIRILSSFKNNREDQDPPLNFELDNSLPRAPLQITLQQAQELEKATALKIRNVASIECSGLRALLVDDLAAVAAEARAQAPRGPASSILENDAGSSEPTLRVNLVAAAVLGLNINLDDSYVGHFFEIFGQVDDGSTRRFPPGTKFASVKLRELSIENLLVKEPEFRTLLVSRKAGNSLDPVGSADGSNNGSDNNGDRSERLSECPASVGHSTTASDVDKMDTGNMLTLKFTQLSSGERKVRVSMDHEMDAAWQPVLVARVQHCLAHVNSRKPKSGSVSAAPSSVESAPVQAAVDTGTPLESSQSASSASPASNHYHEVVVPILDASIQIACLQLRLDKESDLRSLLRVSLRETFVRYRSFSVGPDESDDSPAIEEAATLIEGRIGDFVAEDACKEHTQYRRLVGLLSYGEQQHQEQPQTSVQNTALVRFSFLKPASGHNQKLANAAVLAAASHLLLSASATTHLSEAGGNVVSLHLAPLRVVWLQQLALEALDYVVEVSYCMSAPFVYLHCDLANTSRCA